MAFSQPNPKEQLAAGAVDDLPPRKSEQVATNCVALASLSGRRRIRQPEAGCTGSSQNPANSATNWISAPPDGRPLHDFGLPESRDPL